MSGWQPIATAPKDGTRILLWEPDGAYVGRWFDDGVPNVGDAPGWLGLVHDDSGVTGLDPSHWMPLPAPPNTGLPAREGVMLEVRTAYNGGYSEAMDAAAHNAAGRLSDFGGMGCDGNRDLGWIVGSDIEAERIKGKLRAAGFRVELRSRPDHWERA